MSHKNLSSKRSRLELLQEFEAAPESALFKQEMICAIRDILSMKLFVSMIDC